MTGILIVNLGTPDAPSRGAVYRYLKQFLLDPRVIDINPVSRNLLVRGIIAPFRSKNSSDSYKLLWTEKGSPLKFYGESLVKGVQEALGSEYMVELAMRYQSPSIASALERMKKAQVHKIKVLPLFPQYASASTGSVQEEVMRLLSRELVVPSVEFISEFATYGPMIDVFVKHARQFDIDSYDHILFSYHGIPQRHLRNADPSGNHCLQKADCCQTLTSVNQYCYSAQCYATTRALVERLGLKKEQYTVSFQSRLGRDPWTQPYTIRTLEMLAKEKGAKRLLVFCPAFTADCLETIVEIGIEYKEEFVHWGGEHVDLVPSLNDDPDWIKGVADMVR